MAEGDQLQDLLQFLTLETRLDVLSVALHHVLGLTGSVDGIRLFKSDKRYLEAIFTLTRHPQESVATDSYLALVNLSTDVAMAKIITFDYDLVSDFVQYVLKSDSVYADFVCGILSNITRDEHCCEKVLEEIEKSESGLSEVVEVICKDKFNPKNKLHYLGQLLSNLTQLPQARRFILDKERCVVQRLLAFTEYEGSVIRRGGIIGTLKNCCFETAYHLWLLSDEVDILPRLLLPLAGPEELSEEDMDGMPEDLQFLEDDKQREPDPAIRKMLIGAIFQLCATKEGRKIVKDKRAYVILRELDKQETDPEVSSVCHKLISLLISDEPEEGMENLNEVEIPEDVQRELTQADEEEKSNQIKKE
ncbi:protein HGH1 homolog [Ptychodera flava]|uniref:protein HGH1 homolog n=1 Tax=Ptychodera flava TaxID=63121 RepID=UPI003969D557